MLIISGADILLGYINLPITLHLYAFILSSLMMLILMIQTNNVAKNIIINMQSKSKQRIKSSLKKQKQLEEQLIECQEELESTVQERTLELHIALQELEDANRELSEINTRDELTGLYNRRFYDQKIQAEFRRSRRNLSHLSLLIIDIDHFKKVNDNYGHLAGDHCLKAVSNTIKTAVQRSADIACRYGGEEFCIILPETDQQGSVLFAEELRKNIEQLLIQHEEQKIPLTISCGIAVYQQQKNATPESIFTLADQALYQAKKQGRNQVKIAENEQDTEE
jgi:diguanylate cyclase (GGDEF)-like protein